MQPVILIGAARSGTKLLRDMIAHHPKIGAVPYDINYIWRMGNEQCSDDVLTPTQLTTNYRERIRKEVFTFAPHGTSVLVEKSVSNCLRVPYVQKVFPEAKYIHLLRDGRDVVESSYRQWTIKPDWRYILKKARGYPITKAPGYAMQYAMSTLRRTLSSESAVRGFWGPRYPGIERDLEIEGTLAVCAHQWVHSVTTALSGFEQIERGSVLTVRYESFVEEPLTHLEQIALFIGVEPTPYQTMKLDSISLDNIGKGWRNFNSEEQQTVMKIIGETLKRLQSQSITQNG